MTNEQNNAIIRGAIAELRGINISRGYSGISEDIAAEYFENLLKKLQEKKQEETK